MAVIQIGGKQYCVAPGQTIVTDRVNEEVGKSFACDNLLGGEQLEVEVVAHQLGDKVVSRKFRNKTRYSRVRGHRQPQTLLTIKTAEVKAPKKAATQKAKKDEA